MTDHRTPEAAGRTRRGRRAVATTVRCVLGWLVLGASVSGCAGRQSGEGCPCQTTSGGGEEAEAVDGPRAIAPAKYSQFPYSRIADAYDRALEWRVRNFARRGSAQARHAPALRRYLMRRSPKSQLFSVVARLYHEYFPLFDLALGRPDQLARDRDLAWALFAVRSFALDWSYQSFFKGTVEYRTRYLERGREPPRE